MEKLTGEIERLRRDKDNMIAKQQVVRKEEEDKARKIEATEADIQKAGRNIKAYTEKLINKTHDISVYSQLLIEVKAKHAQELVSNSTTTTTIAPLNNKLSLI